MRIKALKSFASKEIAPTSGQVFDCSEALALDLIGAGYAIKMEEKEPAAIKEEKKATEKVEEKKDENKSGNKKHAVSSAKGKRAGSK